jgi:hypothetical protein
VSLKDSLRWFSNAPALRTPFVLAVDALQREPGVVQVMTPAVMLVCFCDALGIDPQEVVSQVKRMQRDLDGPFATQWAAMRAYAKGELKQ